MDNIYKIMNDIDDNASLVKSVENLNEGIFDSKEKKAAKAKEVFSKVDPSGKVTSVGGLAILAENEISAAIVKAIPAAFKKDMDSTGEAGWNRFVSSLIKLRESAARTEFIPLMKNLVQLYTTFDLETYAVKLKEIQDLGQKLYRQDDQMYKALCKTINKELPEKMSAAIQKGKQNRH